MSCQGNSIRTNGYGIMGKSRMVFFIKLYSVPEKISLSIFKVPVCIFHTRHFSNR